MKHRQPREQMTKDLIHLIVGKPLTLHTDNVQIRGDRKGQKKVRSKKKSQKL
jgi:hypothetical protein